MNRVTPQSTLFDSVNGKVVVVSGGSNGIGAATVERLYSAQANVVFGDTDEDAAESLAARLVSEVPDGGEVAFVKCDVTDHADVYKLFKTAYDKFGHIDHAFAIAGIFEQGDWFDPELTIESVEHAEESTAVLDVNMKGTAIFARIAVVFLRSGMLRRKNNRSLTLTSSVAVIMSPPGLHLYHAAKHGVLGFLRSMRNIEGIRINCICPGVTETPMTTTFFETFREEGHVQTADDCARFYIGVANNPSMNGKAIYVENGKGWEFESGLRKTMPTWLGEEPTLMLRDNMKAMKKVSCFLVRTRDRNGLKFLPEPQDDDQMIRETRLAVLVVDSTLTSCLPDQETEVSHQTPSTSSPSTQHPSAPSHSPPCDIVQANLLRPESQCTH